MCSLLRILLIIVWSSALFESGWGVVVDYLGVSLFIISALSLFFLTVIIKASSRSSISNVGLSSLDFGIIVAILLYAAYYILSALWAPSIPIAISAVAELCWYFLVFVTSLLVIVELDSSVASSITRKVGLITICALFFGFILKTSGAYGGDGWGGTSISLFRDYNVYSQVLFLSFTAMFVGSGVKGNLQGIVLYIFIILFVIIVGVASGSRRALMLYGPLAVIFPFFLSLLRSNVRFALKFFLSALVCVSLAIVISTAGVISSLTPAEASRAERATGFITGAYNENNRINRWENSIELYGEGSMVEMIFGQGVRSYLQDERFIRQNGDADSPHNFLLSALIEGGVVQVMLLIVFGLLMAIKLYSIAKRYEFWLANFVLVNFFIWVVGVTISFQGFFDGKVVFFILLVVLSAKARNLCPSIRYY